MLGDASARKPTPSKRSRCANGACSARPAVVRRRAGGNNKAPLAHNVHAGGPAKRPPPAICELQIHNALQPAVELLSHAEGLARAEVVLFAGAANLGQRPDSQGQLRGRHVAPRAGHGV